jgi:hypothetical protein
VSLTIGGRAAAFGFSTRDTPGRFEFENFYLSPRERRRVRAGVGRRARVTVSVNDLKGNRRRVVRTVRITR